MRDAGTTDKASFWGSREPLQARECYNEGSIEIENVARVLIRTTKCRLSGYLTPRLMHQGDIT